MSDAAALDRAEVEPAEGEAGDIDLSERPSNLLRRDADLLGRVNSPVRKYLAKHIDAIVRGFEEQASRSDDLDKYWNIFNCVLDENQFYNSNAQVYVPIIRDAVNARATRFTNQLFPQSGRYVDATASDGKIPYEIVALLNHYIADAKLKTSVVRPLMRAGDIEGQYNLYIGWEETERHIVSRETHPPIDPQTGVQVPGEDVVDIVEEAVIVGRPVFEVLHDSDVLVLPATADSLDDAFAKGGSATIVRRWSKDTFEAMIDRGEVKEPPQGSEAKSAVEPGLAGLSDLTKKLARAVGVRAKAAHILIFETWLMMPLSERGGHSEKGEKRLCRLWWAVDKEPLGLKRNPYWNDRCPLLSAPVEKVAGVFKGKSLVEPLAPLQWEANDAANERADADHYGAMPIIARKPGEGNAPLVLNLAAVWDAAPGDIQFMQFPDLSQRAKARILDAMQIIFQSLGVNPAMLPQQTGRPGAKRNQAEIALEQSVDLLTVAEAVEVPTEHILSPLAAWIVDLDHQFRDDRDVTVRMWGELGLTAEMVSVGPLQNGAHYRFTWAGAQQAKFNAGLMQQGTALLATAERSRQQLTAEGYQLRLGPVFEQAFMNVFGPETGRLVLLDQRRQLTIHAETENDMMLDGFAVDVHPMDPDEEHIAAHHKAMIASGDPYGTIRVHLQAHLKQRAMKAAAMMQQQMMRQQQMGRDAAPGGPPAGAQPGLPRPMRGPPGTIHPDRMPAQGGGVVPMPRKT